MAELSKKFLRLFVKGNKELAKKYRAEEGCPYLVFLDSKGKEFRIFAKRDLVPMKPADLRKKMEEIVKELTEKKKP